MRYPITTNAGGKSFHRSSLHKLVAHALDRGVAEAASAWIFPLRKVRNLRTFFHLGPDSRNRMIAHPQQPAQQRWSNPHAGHSACANPRKHAAGKLGVFLMPVIAPQSTLGRSGHSAAVRWEVLGRCDAVCGSQDKEATMATYPSRRRLGVRKVQVRDVEHIRVHYDPNLYMYAPNRGGIWNFGDGEIAVAYLTGPVDYQALLPPGRTSRHAQPVAERGAKAGGVMLSRSFDYGQTWPDSERAWIWHNDRTQDEILDWLRPVTPEQREQIDLSEPDSIIHFCHGEYLKFPFGGIILQDGPRLDPGTNFHLGRRQHPPSFSLRSRDRGRTWERHATLIEGPSWAPDGGFLCVNLGHVQFDNGVLGIVGGTYHRNIACFYVSYDNGLSWQYVSEITRAARAPDPGYGYSYLGVHRLPDGRLMCSMHQLPENWPHASFSEDDGMSWSPPRAIVGPGTYPLPLTGPLPDQAPGDSSGPGTARPVPWCCAMAVFWCCSPAASIRPEVAGASAAW